MLVDYLLQHYVARVEEDSAFAATFPHPPADVRRAMRLTSGPDSAPLTIALTAFGVVVHAGALHDFEYPDRRGDAWQHLSDVVLAVAAGAYREAYPIGRRRFAGFAIATRDGSGEGSQGPVADVDPALLKTAATRLAELADGWQPWRLRERSTELWSLLLMPHSQSILGCDQSAEAMEEATLSVGHRRCGGLASPECRRTVNRSK